MKQIGKIIRHGALGLLATAWLPPPGVRAQNTTAAFRPLAHGEKLTYKILWPSGIRLGEAILEASPSGAETHFQVTVEVSLPQYALRHITSSAAAGEGLCSLRFHQETGEGAKKWWEESVEFDQAAHEAHRTRDGQTTTASIAACAQDPLTFIYYFRSRLAEGKPLDSGTLYRGGNFNVRVRAAGAATVAFRGQQRAAEKYVVTYPSQNQEMTIELWISTDAERVPVRIRVPSPLAVFTAELE
ncbi:MAG: DUF3108 domain-containing protein [Acidobacteria bacterium]|nr:DUF3108 domain-containing protein [Acidobacteriota bacterium]